MTESKKTPLLKSTRAAAFPKDTFDPTVPRLGRRESEPHSEEVTYLYDVLTTNFPDSRALWDLHHYFRDKEGYEIDIQFDISFFLNWKLDRSLSSYRAEQFNNRIPDVAINVLSKSTYRADFSDHKEYCQQLGIPCYIVFAPFNVASRPYKPPFLRVHLLDGEHYREVNVRSVALVEGTDLLNGDAIVDLGDRIPFRVGLLKRARLHFSGDSLYRLVLFEKSRDVKLLTALERERELKEKEKERADRFAESLKKERDRADKLAESLKKERELKEKEKERADKLAALLEKYREKSDGI
ncbi:MAG: hypothetical protein ACTSXP_03375 [Promethearchaeota archaeon]